MLEVVAYRGTKAVGRRRLVTASEAVGLRVAAEPLSGRKGKEGLVYVTLEVLDGKPRLLPDDQHDVSLSFTGPAELLAFGSANPFAVASLQKPATRTYRGRALAILRATGTGKVDLTVRSGSMAPARMSVDLT